MTETERQAWRLTATVRGFVFMALVAPVLWSRDTSALVALFAIGGIWLVSQVVEHRGAIASRMAILIEAALVGAVCGFSLHTSMAVLGALAVAPFTAALYRRLTGLAVALVAEFAAVFTVNVLLFDKLSTDQGFAVFSWGITGIGLALIATFLHSTLLPDADPLSPYRYAQTLIRELIDLSGGLSSGLDPRSLGGAILSAVRDELPTATLALFIPRGETLTPLVTKSMGSTDDLARCEELAVEAWAGGHPVVDGGAFAFPLDTDSSTTAVVAGLLSDRLDPAAIGVLIRIEKVTQELQASAVHLDTALLFAAFRDAATADERRRLAREMHDGAAQDIASLGYLVDALAAGPTSPEQAERIDALRQRITLVIGEVRRSVVSLRTSVGASESLGTAIGSIARNLSEVSSVPIQVTLDEHTTRLRPEIEAELFRIAQEAMNNAIKHAMASTIKVHCQVHAPDALITVTDDGRGLQQARSDSHGLEIMRERALLIGADLTVAGEPDRGLTVSVRVGADISRPTAGSSARVTA